MATKITTHGVMIQREGKLLHLKPGSRFDFTDAEIADLNAGGAIRDPIREVPEGEEMTAEQRAAMESIGAQPVSGSKLPAADDL